MIGRQARQLDSVKGFRFRLQATRGYWLQQMCVQSSLKPRSQVR